MVQTINKLKNEEEYSTYNGHSSSLSGFLTSVKLFKQAALSDVTGNIFEFYYKFRSLS